MNFSESNKEVAAALAKAWGKIETPKHNREVEVRMKDNKGKYTFTYTDLGGILDAVRPALKEHGLSVLQNAYTKLNDQGKNEINVETMLLHESGEWIKSDLLTFQAAFGMQDLGGQISYLKRYSLSALLGLSTDKDDDANGASGNETTDQSQNRNQNKNQTQNKNKNQNRNQQQGPPPQEPPYNDNVPPGADLPPEQPKADPPKMISQGQKTRISILLAAIGQKEGKTKEEVLKLYQDKIKATFEVDKLKMAKASGLISQLEQIEKGDVSLYE